MTSALFHVCLNLLKIAMDYKQDFWYASRMCIHTVGNDPTYAKRGNPPVLPL